MNKAALKGLEDNRLNLQAEMDIVLSQSEKNYLGQFATPPILANDILEYAHKFFPLNTKINFLEPAFGSGSFFSALLSKFRYSQIEKAKAFEIDKRFWKIAKSLWKDAPIEILNSDFTKAIPPRNENDKFNLIVSNPPYVRHHHLTLIDKIRLKQECLTAFGESVSGLSGLYCYFLGIAHQWMQTNGYAAWLIPSEFMDVNYGVTIKRYLVSKVTLIQIHRFNPIDTQFEDALVSSSVVWFKNSPPPNNHKVLLTYGGNLNKPEVAKSIPIKLLDPSDKWSRIPINGVKEKNNDLTIGDLFTIKRGLSTGDNSFFIVDEDKIKKNKIPKKFLRPILPSPRYLQNTIIESDKNGFPIIDNKLFLIDCELPENEIKTKYPSLWQYYQQGRSKGVTNTYSCKTRSPWYKQEKRESPLFACTYIGRPKNNNANPFRFIYNKSKATISNAFLGIYPKPGLARLLLDNPVLNLEILNYLNSINYLKLIEQGRVYGGGMYKLEPRELMNVPVTGLKNILVGL